MMDDAFTYTLICIFGCVVGWISNGVTTAKECEKLGGSMLGGVQIKCEVVK